MREARFVIDDDISGSRRARVKLIGSRTESWCRGLPDETVTA